MRSARFALQAAAMITGQGSGAACRPNAAARSGIATVALMQRMASAAGVIFAVDRLPFPPLVSATMKTALILVGRRVGKAV